MSDHRYRNNSRELQHRAREFRQSMTRAEGVLWEALRGRKVAGTRFRRQHPVGRFILDFYCPTAKLCIEVDGGIHDTDAVHDEERSAALAAGGYQVLRVRNEEVLGDLPSVLARIEAAVRRSQPPLPIT